MTQQNKATVIGDFYNLNPVYSDNATKAEKDKEKQLKDRVIEDVSMVLISNGMVDCQKETI